MKNTTECTSLEEIRSNIDTIDKSIVDLLSQRASYVNEAARYKKDITDVKASQRVASMIKQRRQWAEQSGLNADFVEKLFMSIVNFFIGKESKQWNATHKFSDQITISKASADDARSILSLQKRAFIQEAELINNYSIMPLVQSIDMMMMDFNRFTIFKAEYDSRIIGSARVEIVNSTCYIGRVIVEPLYQKHGVGRLLMHAIESQFHDIHVFKLFTGESSVGNIEFYSKLGYSIFDRYTDSDGVNLVKMRKSLLQ
jgi:chorismate mutase-like protein